MRKKHMFTIDDKHCVSDLLEFNLENYKYKTSIVCNGQLGKTL